jgi:hypothetical protein
LEELLEEVLDLLLAALDSDFILSDDERACAAKRFASEYPQAAWSR